MPSDSHAPDHVTTAPPPPPPVRKPRRWRRWLFLLCVALVVGGFFFFQSRQTHAGSTAQTKGGGRGRGGAGGPIPVAAAVAQRSDVPVYLDGLGSVTAYYTVAVHSRIDGELMSINYKEGQYVKAGDVIAQIDPRPYQVQLEQAEGQMARDEALLANARLDLERYKTLLAQDAIPKQQLDTQASAVKQYEGTVKTDQAAIDNAKLQLTYCRITAPISGRIGLRQVDPGNIVHASDQNGMLVITQLQPITVLFTLPEDALPAVVAKLRRNAPLPIDAYNRDRSAKLASGKLLTVDNQIDPSTGTSRLKGIFENREGNLFPNQFVNVRLLVDTKRAQVIVPTVAIQRGSQNATFVYVIEQNSTVQVRNVVTDVTVGNNTSITSGLNPGEKVVVDGADKLQPGGKVSLRPENGGPGGGRRGKGGAANTGETGGQESGGPGA